MRNLGDINFLAWQAIFKNYEKMRNNPKKEKLNRK